MSTYFKKKSAIVLDLDLHCEDVFLRDFERGSISLLFAFSKTKDALEAGW